MLTGDSDDSDREIVERGTNGRAEEDGRRFTAKRGTGEALTEAILESGVPSLNEFERISGAVPWFRSIYFKKNYKELVMKALSLAQSSVLQLSFWSLIKNRISKKDVSVQLYECLDPLESFKWMERILIHNDINSVGFYKSVFDCIDKRKPKINTLLFIGPPNAGKTMIAESIARCCVFYCNIQHFSKYKSFVFGDALNKRCIMINEPRITDEHVQTIKNIFEGCSTTIDKKFKDEMQLPRTPVIVTSNQELGTYLMNEKDVNSEALNVRCERWFFATMPSLKDCKGAFHPGMWWYAAKMLVENNVNFTDAPVDLESFYTDAKLYDLEMY